jgi:maltooligosyltrehalose trehalohydrolase
MKPRLGAHVEHGGVRFAALVDAARCQVELVSANGAAKSTLELEAVGDGYFERLVTPASAGTRYWFVVDGRRLPDPYARYLPEGVHGPAEVIEPRYALRNLPPPRLPREHVIYELHVGTFTEEGTFDAARKRLPALAELGVTTLELMPVAAFAGERGWGYDGVGLFATHAAYGTPDQLRELIDAAHGLGLSVLLDVVYNHFGPSGNYLSAYSARYFHPTRQNAWGQAPNFSEPAMRELVLDNARYWLRELGFDGLRLDATHAILDDPEPHLLSELARVAHELEPRQLVIAEDERNLASLVTRQGLDALWADDFHHQLRVTMTGEQHGYYGNYVPGVAGIASVIERGWSRGEPAEGLPAEALVYCIQNHDQVGNRAFGDRLGASIPPDLYRGVSLLLLFLPMTPLLFMGQEWGASTPFAYFTDHEAELGRQVSEGRRREFAGFPDFSRPEARERIPDPQARATFEASKLRWSERELPEHAATLALYRSALALRRSDPVLRGAGREQLVAEAHAAVLAVHRALDDDRRTLVVNLGREAADLDALIARFGLQDVRRVLESAPFSGSSLLSGQAVLLAGRGKLPEQS